MVASSCPRRIILRSLGACAWLSDRALVADLLRRETLPDAMPETYMGWDRAVRIGAWPSAPLAHWLLIEPFLSP